MITKMYRKKITPSDKGNDGVFVAYPSEYCGQDLSEEFVFIDKSSGDAMAVKGVYPEHYLQNFADEVARATSQRAKQYIEAYPVGQRFLWTFTGEDIVLLSLVVLLPIGPRTVMCTSTRENLCDENGQLKHHTETVIRWAIEQKVGTSTHCK